MRGFPGYGTHSNKDFQKFQNILQLPSSEQIKANIYPAALGVTSRMSVGFEGGSQSEKRDSVFRICLSQMRVK
jgi:hypothetical protein